jgi:hypothetical protein
MTEVQKGIDTEEKRLQGLRSDEKELTVFKATAVEMEDVLIKAIEDQAEKCMEQIMKNKDTLKKQVKKEFEVIRVLTQQLEAMSGVISESEEAIKKAQHLLSETEIRPKYLEKLCEPDVIEEFHQLKVENSEYVRNKKSYRSNFQRLKQKSLKFYPKTRNLNIGGLQEPDPEKIRATCKGKGFCICEICGRKLL